MYIGCSIVDIYELEVNRVNNYYNQSLCAKKHSHLAYLAEGWYKVILHNMYKSRQLDSNKGQRVQIIDYGPNLTIHETSNIEVDNSNREPTGIKSCWLQQEDLIAVKSGTKNECS